MTGKSFLLLLIAIISETAATLALKASDGFTKLAPSIITVVGYAAALYFLSITIKVIPVGIAYAIWSGVGIVLVTFFAIFYYKQIPDLAAIIGMILIIAGVVVLNLFSKTPVE